MSRSEKPNVQHLVDELSGVVERWYDRWQTAITATRVANYPYKQYGADVMETWIDGAYALAVPWALLGGCEIKRKPPFFVERMTVAANKSNVTAVVPVAALPDGTTSAVSDKPTNVEDNTKSIPAAHVQVQLVKKRYVVVTLVNLAQVPTVPAGVYVADILALPDKDAIARIEVVWPG